MTKPKYTRVYYYEDKDTLKFLKSLAKQQTMSATIRDLTKALKDKSK